MKNLSTSCCLLLALVAGAALAQSKDQKEPYRPDPGTPEQTAREALRIFATLVTPENYKAMGFDNPQQIRSATLGKPLPRFMIRLDELKRYQGSTDPAQLLHSMEVFTYPVVVDESTKSSLTVRNQKGRWQPESFGAPTYARLLIEVRDRLANESRDAELFEVQVPALNLSFVGLRREGRVLLAPVQDDPRFELKRGQPQPAEQVLQALQTAAREHNELPT